MSATPGNPLVIKVTSGPPVHSGSKEENRANMALWRLVHSLFLLEHDKTAPGYGRLWYTATDPIDLQEMRELIDKILDEKPPYLERPLDG